MKYILELAENEVNTILSALSNLSLKIKDECEKQIKQQENDTNTTV